MADKSEHMVIDQTLLTTPQPRACSTVKKQSIIRNNLLRKSHITTCTDTTSSTRDSLGILSLNDVDLTPTLERPRAKAPNQDNCNLSKQLQKQRQLAEGVLSGKQGLTSMHLKSMVKSEKKSRMASESTIDDSDFLSNMSARSSFYPNNISTPRSSTASVEHEGSISSGLNIAGNISLLADKIKHSDTSIKDLCKQYGSLLIAEDSTINDSFLSSPDEAAKMIQHDEDSWHNKYDAIPQQIHDSIFSNLRESITMDEKPSMGEFFKMKSEDCSRIFTRQSPDKETVPSALISNSTMIDESNNTGVKTNDNNKSLADYNISDIVRLISNEKLSKSDLIECLAKADCKTNHTGTIPKIEVVQSMRKCSPKPKVSTKKIKESSRNDALPSIRMTRSPTCSSPRNTYYTDTFASDKLSPNISSSKSSSDDLSDKENTASIRNVSPCGNPHCGSPNRSVTSLRSGSSLDHLIDGRVPIESTKVEMVWASVKLGKSSSKDFVLRNKVHQKIRFQIMVSGSCFKIIKPEGESQLPLSVLLHPLESRSFTVLFTPTSTGAYSERLIFQPITKTSTQDKPSQKVLLFGYGGHISPTIRNLLKDSTGKYWLPLGNIDEICDTITKKFTITNSGTLAAFVDVTVTLKYLLVFTGLTISPNIAIIPVGASQQFELKYIPNKDDFRRLKYGGSFNSNVCEVVVIKCVFGSEILRARIRRLAGKLDRHVSPTDTLITRIIESFPRENIPSDVRLITESVSSLTYLIQHLDCKEIIVTIEQDIDKTLVPSHIDSTSFQTLCFDTSDVSCIKQNPDMFNVHPKSIVLCPRIKNSDVVFFVNNSDKVICYEVHCSSNLVNVVPRSGNVLPHKNSMIRISCKDNINPHKNDSLTLSIYTDHSCIEIDVQIMSLNVPS